MHGNIYQILLIMSSLLPWVWPTPTLSFHDMIPCMYMSQLISPLQYLPFKVFFTLSWCTNLYVSFFIATSGMYKEFKRKLCQNQWMVKATSAAECYSWLYEGGGGKINMSFACDDCLKVVQNWVRFKLAHWYWDCSCIVILCIFRQCVFSLLL